jgi:hypothetical protein
MVLQQDVNPPSDNGNVKHAHSVSNGVRPFQEEQPEVRSQSLDYLRWNTTAFHQRDNVNTAQQQRANTHPDRCQALHNGMHEHRKACDGLQSKFHLPASSHHDKEQTPLNHNKVMSSTRHPNGIQGSGLHRQPKCVAWACRCGKRHTLADDP